MKKPIQVLIIEDSSDDTQLLVLELRRGGFDPSYEQVDSPATLASALERRPWDVIISDHSMPGFGSLNALNIIKEKNLDIPFIVLSGAIGEDAAVTVMKAGASDYVGKGNLARLIPSIERELREAESRRSRRQAEEGLAYLAAIVKSSDDAIIGKTLDGTIHSWNGGAERMYGYSAEEVKGRCISMLIPPSRPEELSRIFSRIREGEPIERYETVRLTKGGASIDVSLTLSPIKDASGKIIGISAIERNITARKQEEADRLKLIYELTEALGKIKTLSGLLPICSSCKHIRDDKGYWQKVESYISEHTDVEFTHGICPDCLRKLYPEYAGEP